MAYFVETSYGLIVNLDAIAYFNGNVVVFINGDKFACEKEGELHRLLRDYISRKPTECPSQTNASNQTEGRTY